MNFYFSIFVLLVVFIAAMNTLYAHFYKVPNMPSMPQTRRKIANNIREKFGNCDGLVIYDLGSGWGGLCHKLAKYFPIALITGYEISPIPYVISTVLQMINPFHHYTLKRQDIFTVDVSKADIIVCYLTHYHMKKLEAKMMSEAKKGCILYSQGFPCPTLKPIQIIPVKYSLEQNIYCYQFE